MTEPSNPLTAEDIRFVDQLVREGGRMALEMRNGVGIRTKSSPDDLVTDADLKISRWLIAELSGRFPNDLIVSEEDNHSAVAVGDEAALTVKHASQRTWLIDPIDGTENYVKEDGQYSCMIGFLFHSKPYYGWIFQPSTNTLFYGGNGSGAWKQREESKAERYELHPSLSELHEIRLMMGWGDRRKHPWVMDLPRVRYVSSQSLGLKIIKILEDTADIFVSLTGRVKLWDTAAPAAIALAAGLDVGTADGADLPYPIPNIQHGSSVIIGRPGSISWAVQNLHGHTTSSR